MKTHTILALPSPSLQRHLERCIHPSSLTGIGANWCLPRHRVKQRTARLTPWQLNKALRECRGSIHINNPPHPKTGIWAVASVHYANGLSLSYVWAINKKGAIASHRDKIDESRIGDEVNITAIKIGGGK